MMCAAAPARRSVARRVDGAMGTTGMGEWPIGGGAMGALIRAHDWSRSPLGPPAGWPAILRTTVALILPAEAQIVLFWGADYCALYNDAYAPTIGDKHPHALGRPASEYWTELWDDLKPLLDTVRETGRTVAAKDRPFQIARHGYLEEVFFDISYSPVRDDDGTIAGVLCLVAETTEVVRARATEDERARLAAALAAGERRLLGEIFQKAPAFLHVLRGPDFIIEMANDAYHELTGRQELLGQPAFDALPESVADGFQARIAAVMDTGEPFAGREVPVTLARTPGAPPEERLIDLLYLPLPAAPSGEARVLGYGTDVTEQVAVRRAAADERAARAEAEAAVAARDTFLSIATHELRTPLTTLKGTVQLLRRQRARGLDDPERFDRTLGMLEQSAARLGALLDDLLDVTRLRGDRLPLDARPTDLAALVAEAVAAARDRAGEGHALALTAPDDLPAIPLDAIRIGQVLTNLLENAIKYSPDGGTVATTVRREGEQVVVAVRDGGIGLPSDAAEAIFAPFGRAANAAASRLPGMGLGLFICRGIVEQHGGRIWATSDGVGRGTVITFTLPLAGPPALPAPTA